MKAINTSPKTSRQYPSLWIGISLLILVTAVLLGGIMYWWQGKKVKRTYGEEAVRRRELESEVQRLKHGCDLKGEKKEMDNFIRTDQNLKPQGYFFKDRLIGDGCYKKDLQDEEFREDFNLALPNTVIRYVNKEEEILFDISYNKNWGNRDCVVLPYFEYMDEDQLSSVIFGKPGTFVADQYNFSIGPARSSNEIIIEQNNVAGSPPPNPRVKIINNRKVVIYESYGMIDSRIIEVIGKKNNYIFTELGFDGESGELERIIATAQFPN